MMNRKNIYSVSLGIGVVLFGAGCATKAPAPVVCAPMGDWPETFELSGDYTISLTATSGAEVGAVTTGSMSLAAVEDETTSGSGYRRAYVGSMDFDLMSVGALEMGSIESDDPTSPGVLVQIHDSDGTVEILLRLGSEANRTDRTRFDGGYTVLRVNGLSADGFGGNWTSGVSRTNSEGTFCAIKM